MLPIEVELENFCCHKSYHVQYQDGLTLVVAANGKGKSAAFPEAIAWGVWGSLIRGSSPRTRGLAPNQPTSVKVVFQHNGATYRTTRTVVGKKTTFAWSRDGQTTFKYETSTKAQAALEAEVGDLDTWLATSLFAGDDAAMFSRATDTQRKKLLEKMLGLERIDAGADASRKLLNTLKLQVSGIRQRLNRTEGQVAGLSASLEQLEQLGGVSTAVADTAVELKLRQDQLATIEEESRATQTAISEAKLETDRASRSVTRVLNGKCVACNQTVAQSVLERQTREANLAEARYADVVAKLSTRARDCALEIRAMTGRVQALQAQLVQARAAAQYQTQIDAISDQLGELYVAQLDQQAELATLERDLQIQEHVVRVLGPKGVRAQRLQKVLGTIAKLANTYLTWLSPGIRLRILPYTELVGGGVSDQFSLVVDGVGDGTYASASGGERRRIDIALVLALSQLRKSDMIYTDDLLDALDEEGAKAVCQLLVDISARRRVVVLTHTQNKEMLDAIRGYASNVVTL